MPQKSWTLLDAAKDVYLEKFSIGPSDLDTAQAPVKVGMRTLRGGLRDGVDVIEVDNGALRFTVLPQRGMGIWKGWLGEVPIAAMDL
jgi:hypothetical protein